MCQIEEAQVFNPEISTMDNLGEGFQIFIDASAGQDTGSMDYSRAGVGICFSQDDQKKPCYKTSQ